MLLECFGSSGEPGEQPHHLPASLEDGILAQGSLQVTAPRTKPLGASTSMQAEVGAFAKCLEDPSKSPGLT